MFSCIGTEGSKGSLLRNGWFKCFSVKELKVPKVPYLEMGGSNVLDRKSTRLNSSHLVISYAVFCVKKTSTKANVHEAIWIFQAEKKLMSEETHKYLKHNFCRLLSISLIHSTYQVTQL